MCSCDCPIKIPVSEAPHGWLRVTKDQFFAWVGPRDIIVKPGRAFDEFTFRNRQEAGRKYKESGDFYLLAAYARTVN